MIEEGCAPVNRDQAHVDKDLACKILVSCNADQRSGLHVYWSEDGWLLTFDRAGQGGQFFETYTDKQALISRVLGIIAQAFD